MIDDMMMRNLHLKTQIAYLRAVKRLADFLGRSPDTATTDDLKAFQLNMVKEGFSSINVNATITGLKYFFNRLLGNEQVIKAMVPLTVPRKIPAVLSFEEITQILNTAQSLKYKAALSVAYGAGLKIGEVTRLCVAEYLGGHSLECKHCNHGHVAYNLCRNRHCPKCQSTAAYEWLEKRKEECLPVNYFHVVFTIAAELRDIAYQNKAEIYDALFRNASKTLLTIAADPKHLGARLGIIMVLHTWSSTMIHHPHVHCIVLGGGLNLNDQWVASKPNFLVPARVLSKFFKGVSLQAIDVHNPNH